VSCIIIADCNITEDSPGVLCPVALTVPVNEASGCSAVQAGFDGVELAYVHSSDFHWQE